MTLVYPGYQSGMLTALQQVEDKIEKNGKKTARRKQWLCKCECGEMTVVLQKSLTGKHRTQSCGCLVGIATRKAKTKHGQCGTVLYSRWQDMKKRCLNPNNKHYSNYGGRGITICDDWMDFELFAVWANSNGFNPDLTLERIDVHGDYCPDNCKWITIQEQAYNKQDTRYLTAFGETKQLILWAQDPRCKVEIGTLRSRVVVYGWEAEKAMTVPPSQKNRSNLKRITLWGECKTLGEWLSDDRCKISRTTLKERLRRGWDFESAISHYPGTPLLPARARSKETV